MSFPLRILCALVLALSFGAPASAQDAGSGEPRPAPVVLAPGTAPAVIPGPTAESASLVATLSLGASEATPALPAQRTSQDVAMMAVGGAGLLVGAIIGGDAGTLVMVGSAGVGLLGLYRYLS